MREAKMEVHFKHIVDDIPNCASNYKFVFLMSAACSFRKQPIPQHACARALTSNDIR